MASRIRSGITAPAAHSSLLPFNFDPPSRSYLYSALPLGIITREEGLRGPALNHHLQLFFPASKLKAGGHNGHVRFLPGVGPTQFAQLGYYSMEARYHDDVIASRPTDLIHECADLLAQGAYLRAIINEFFIPGSTRYMKKHHRHDILLIGYSRERKTFQYVAYQSDGSLAVNEVPACVLIEGMHLRRYGVFKEAVPVALEIIRLRTESPAAINRDLIKVQLQEYLSGVDNVAKYHPGGAFSIPGVGGVVLDDPAGYCGVRVYDCYETYFRFCSSFAHRIDLRATRVLMEHKAMIKLTLVALFTGTNAITAVERFDAVIALTRKLHLTAFALSQHPDRARVDSLISISRDIRGSEESLLSDLLGRC